MKQLFDGKLYNTETATVIASDRYWDGHNFERSGRNTYLYKTKKGNYFVYCSTMWQGERDTIEVITLEEAQGYYETLPEHEVEYAEAFGVEPVEA